MIDLAGRAVTPGLIDAHSHLVGLGEALEQVDLVGAATYDEVVRRVREAARALPAGAWVRGRGWDQNRWPDKRFPTHEALSAAVPDHPVWLTRVDGHAALVNARAMAILRHRRGDQGPHRRPLPARRGRAPHRRAGRQRQGLGRGAAAGALGRRTAGARCAGPPATAWRSG